LIVITGKRQRALAEALYQLRHCSALVANSKVMREFLAVLGENLPRSAGKTTGEIEASLCAAMARFEQGYMGCGPKQTHDHSYSRC
jgi:hypothetical protein